MGFRGGFQARHLAAAAEQGRQVRRGRYQGTGEGREAAGTFSAQKRLPGSPGPLERA